MKEIWVMTERSDFYRGGEYDFENYDSGCRAFADFDTAKKAFRERIKRIAETDSSMFENGMIKNFKEYLYDTEFEEINTDDLSDMLTQFFNDTTFEISAGEMDNMEETDYMVAIQIKDGELLIRGDDDGPCNGVNPYIKINCFTMNYPNKDYCIHIEDGFLMDRDFTSQLFLELRKTEIE